MTMPSAPDDADLVRLATLVRPQGRHGEILADILTDFPERFAERKDVWLVSEQNSQPSRQAKLERAWPHKGRIVLKFAGVDSINDASLLNGWSVAIPRDQRAALDEDAVYIDDLVGCRLFDETTSLDLGTVRGVERGEGGAADLLLIARDEQPASNKDDLLVPFAKAYLVGMDLQQRSLRMRLPAGLADLNAPLTPEERELQQRAREDA